MVVLEVKIVSMGDRIEEIGLFATLQEEQSAAPNESV
jgi:hypothetical protein